METATLKEVQELEKGTLVFSTNGAAYRIMDGKIKTVKKIHKYSLDSFVLNEEEDYLPTEVENRNTRILKDFLKKHFEFVSFRGGFIRLQGFKIHYDSHGYCIIDEWNFGRKVNCNEYHNDFSTPEEVLDYLKGNIKRKLESAPEDSERVTIKNKLASKFKIKEDNTMTTNSKTAKRDEKVSKELRVQKEKKIKAPKFLLTDLEEPIDLIKEGDLLNYKLQGPSKKYEVTCTVSEFLAKQVLHHFPKSMALLMKIGRGVETLKSIKDLPLKGVFLKDEYEHFDYTHLRNEETMEEVIKVCYEILHFHGIATPLDYDWNVAETLNLKKKTLIQVYWANHFTWYNAEVISTDKGVKVVYEDGDIDYVYNFQKVRLLS